MARGGKPLSSPEFGKWLEEKRGQRSLEQIAILIRPHVKLAGLKVERSNLDKYEAGRVPSWPLIFAFSTVLGVSIMETLGALVKSIQFTDSGQKLLVDPELMRRPLPPGFSPKLEERAPANRLSESEISTAVERARLDIEEIRAALATASIARRSTDRTGTPKATGFPSRSGLRGKGPRKGRRK